MEENENLEDFNTHSQKKRPNLLIVLIILSGFYIASNSFGIIKDLGNGPLPQEKIKKQLSLLYTSINDLKTEKASESIINNLNIMVDNIKYINTEAFYLYNILTLYAFLIGAISIVLMFKLKKIGFHLYIIYSLLPIISMYIIVPIGLVSTLSIVFTLLTGTLFSLLYGKNLKYMK